MHLLPKERKRRRERDEKFVVLPCRGFIDGFQKGERERKELNCTWRKDCGETVPLAVRSISKEFELQTKQRNEAPK